MIDRLKRLKAAWPEPEPIYEPEQLPFGAFKCSDCGAQVLLYDRIEPGQIAVVKCDCGTNWSFHLPPIVFTQVQNQLLLRPYLEQIAMEFENEAKGI